MSSRCTGRFFAAAVWAWYCPGTIPACSGRCSELALPEVVDALLKDVELGWGPHQRRLQLRRPRKILGSRLPISEVCGRHLGRPRQLVESGCIIVPSWLKRPMFASARRAARRRAARVCRRAFVRTAASTILRLVPLSTWRGEFARDFAVAWKAARLRSARSSSRTMEKLRRPVGAAGEAQAASR